MINQWRRLFPVFVCLLVCISCAQIPVEPVPELYWPLPPEKPRVKFLDLVVGSIDVTGVRSGKFTHLLLGEEEEISFIKPSFVAVKDNIMYVTDISFIHVFDFTIKSYKIIGNGLLKNATGIAVSKDGSIFVGDSSMAKVYVLNHAGRHISTIGAESNFSSLGGIAVDDLTNRLIVSDTKGHKIEVFDLAGKHLFTIGKRGRDKGEFNFPYAVAVDKESRIYVVDSGNFRVQIFDKDGKFLHTFGSVGAIPGTFTRPKGISLDSEGHIYIIDSAFGNFQIFDYSGLPLLAVGTNGVMPGQFTLPIDITLDNNDKIYVVDQMNRRVQIFQYLKETQKEIK